MRPEICEFLGWGARIRTWEWRYQKPLPYHLATPQLGAVPTRFVGASQHALNAIKTQCEKLERQHGRGYNPAHRDWLALCPPPFPCRTR
jgi:hypothetical protein